MAGLLQTLLEKRDFDFVNFVALATTGPIPVGASVDALDYPDGVVIVRVHAVTITGNSSLSVGLYPDGNLGSDSQFFGNTALSSITLSGVAAPYVQTFGAVLLSQLVTLGLVVYRGDSNPMKATLSVDLALRRPDDAITSAAHAAGAPI